MSSSSYFSYAKRVEAHIQTCVKRQGRGAATRFYTILIEKRYIVAEQGNPKEVVISVVNFKRNGFLSQPHRAHVEGYILDFNMSAM